MRAQPPRGAEESFLALFDDLEQQADGLRLSERDVDVAALGAAEYATVDLAARLRASVGRPVRIRLCGNRSLVGRLERTGAGWLLLGGTTPSGWFVRTEAILAITGLSGRAVPTQVSSVVERLSLTSVLRRLADSGVGCQLLLVDDEQLEGRLGRVGADFVEVHVGEGRTAQVELVPVSAVAACQGRG